MTKTTWAGPAPIASARRFGFSIYSIVALLLAAGFLIGNRVNIVLLLPEGRRRHPSIAATSLII